MRPPVSDNIKTAVVQQYLQGKKRDEIASNTGLSGGSVSNIIKNWKNNLLYPVEDLRELAMTLRQLRINPLQCASGARVASILGALGLDEEEFQEFMSVIYSDCLALAINPNKVAGYLRQLLDLCRNMTFSEIPNFVERKRAEIQRLEEKLQELQVREINIQKRVEAALIQEGATRRDLNFKRELWRRDISQDELSQFFDALEAVRQCGYDPTTLISNYHNFLELEAGKIALEEARQKLNNLQAQINAHTQTLSVYQELHSMGFGLKELKKLVSTVREIAEENNIPPHFAIQKLVADIGEHYDDKLGFESELERLKSEIETCKLRRLELQKQPYDFDLNSVLANFLQGKQVEEGQQKEGGTINQTQTKSAGPINRPTSTSHESLKSAGNEAGNEAKENASTKTVVMQKDVNGNENDKTGLEELKEIINSFKMSEKDKAYIRKAANIPEDDDKSLS